eukprot:CAMPEP_0183826160 /NCGR_PEP_ID=MMETSP0807_2-20130328/1547_1 /TAXON_ID=88271 /ORGANISM="Picocystis salinarum, Strain CCMP1897" /LENGTH=34 /DNA_ID= /DNA_START= /DNA_END= /DNA_ORIENTATION=
MLLSEAQLCDETDQRDQIIDSLTTSLGSGEAANA